jgi:hypothetical protein
MPKVKSKGSSKKSLAAGKTCIICGDHVRSQGFPAHLKKCEKEQKEEAALREYEEEMTMRALATLGGMWYSESALSHPTFTFFPQLQVDSERLLGPYQTTRFTRPPNPK